MGIGNPTEGEMFSWAVTEFERRLKQLGLPYPKAIVVSSQMYKEFQDGMCGAHTPICATNKRDMDFVSQIHSLRFQKWASVDDPFPGRVVQCNTCFRQRFEDEIKACEKDNCTLKG